VLTIVDKVSNKLGTENLALILMTIANLLWPLSFLYVSQHHFSPFQTNLARGIAICVTHIIICNYLGIGLDFKSSKDIKYLLIRNTLIGIHQFVYTAMHFVLSFPLINSIVITGPLFVFIIDYFLNGVTINKIQVIGIAVSFTGILININGDFLMTLIDPEFEINSSYEHYDVTDIKIKILFSLLAVLTNVIWGYAIVVQKKIKHLQGIKISFFLGM
jgi:drug/metabolite transporter (DMT)-like permease